MTNPGTARPATGKRAASDLAVLGGQPLFTEPLLIGRPNIWNRDAVIRRVSEAMDRHWLSNDGPLLVELEAAFASFLDVRHCVAVTSATLGLQLLAQTLALRGDVLMPAFTFLGTPRAFEWQGSRPVFCDVLPGRHTLDPAAVRAAMTPQVCAIVGVHLWGQPCEIDALQSIADEYGVPLLFDSAHALGSTWQGQRLGRFGRAEVFSLHATKMINALEGGLITTNDDALAHKLRLARGYGIASLDVFEATGINGKMHEFSAAMGLSNLEGFDAIREHNHALQRAYVDGIGSTPGLRLITAATLPEHNGHYAVLNVARGECPLTREQLRNVLMAESVYTHRYFWPGCDRCPPYDTRTDHPSMPVTRVLCEELLQLPSGLQLQPEDAYDIGRLLALAVNNAAKIPPDTAQAGSPAVPGNAPDA